MAQDTLSMFSINNRRPTHYRLRVYTKSGRTYCGQWLDAKTAEGVLDALEVTSRITYLTLGRENSTPTFSPPTSGPQPLRVYFPEGEIAYMVVEGGIFE